MRFVVVDALMIPKVKGLLSEPKDLCPLLFPALFVRPRVGLVVELEDLLRRAIH